MARYYNHCQWPFVSACRGTSRITIVIYILTVFLSDTFSDSVFNSGLSIQCNYLLLLLHIKIMMDLSWYPLRYAIGDPDVYCVFSQTSSTSQTVLSLHLKVELSLVAITCG